MATSYANPQGSGERRDGSIATWIYKPSGSTAVVNSFAYDLLRGTGASSVYQSSAGEVRFIYDFYRPRVVDAFNLFHSGSGYSLGLYAIEASTDGETWVTLRAADTLMSSTTGTEFAFTNTTPYRYWSLYRPSGNGSTAPYFHRVEFKIDEPEDLSWHHPLSYGDRTGLIEVTGTAWVLLSYAQGFVTSSSQGWRGDTNRYIPNNRTVGSTLGFKFSAPVNLTGMVLTRMNTPSTWDLQARNGTGSWTTLKSGVSLVSTHNHTNDTGAGGVMRWCELEFTNANEYTEYQFVLTSGNTSETNPGAALFRVGGGSSDVDASGPVPSIDWAAPLGVGGGRLVVTGLLPALQYVAPTGTALPASGGPIPSYTWNPPEGSADTVQGAAGSIPGVLWYPPRIDNVMVTQYTTLAPLSQYVTLDVNQVSVQGAVTVTTNVRATQVALLVLATGKEPPLTPSPLVMTDQGQDRLLRQRLVNVYTEPTPDGPARTAHFGRPGLKLVTQRGPGPVRATFLHKGFRYTVSGGEVWRDDKFIGEIPPDGPLRWAVSDEEVVVVTDDRAYYVTLTSVARIMDPDLPRVRDVKFLAGRFVYFDADTSGMYRYSAINDARNIDGLSFASAEANPDRIIGAEVQGEALVIFGELTTEFHFATTDAKNPYRRSPGRTYDKGCLAVQTVQLADNSLFFVSHDRMVCRTVSKPERVSNHAIEDLLRRQTVTQFEQNTAFSIDFGGHSFYVLNIVGYGTWALDIGYESWAEWKSWGKDRFRISVADRNGFMGDAFSGTIYGFDAKAWQDDGDPLERIVSTFKPLKNGSLKNFNLALHCVQGVGLMPHGYGEDPVVEMRFSDHLGINWTNWMTAPLGRHAVRGKESLAMWTSLGAFNSPGRLFEFRVTDPVEFSPYMVSFNEARP